MGVILTGTVVWGHVKPTSDSSAAVKEAEVRLNCNQNRWALVACGALTLGLFSVGQAQTQWIDNGHMYELVTTPLNWNAAKLDAESRTILGVSGHLLTITSQEELDFIINVFGEPIREKWIGGFNTQNQWEWVTGEPWVFTNWAPGEPNGGDALNFHGANALGTWNDITGALSLGYLVEYDITTLIAWPMEAQDRFGTDRAVTGPDPGTIETPWCSVLSGPVGGVSHGPALAFDGNGYFGSWSDNLLTKWNYNTGVTGGTFDALNFIQCTPACGPTGIVYITTVRDAASTTPGRLFAINPDTMDWIWNFVTGYVKVSDWESCSPNVGPDGDVVVGSTIGKIWRLNGATGAVVWDATLGECRYTIPFSRDDSMVLASNGSAMTALNYADGSVAWSVTLGSRLGAPGVAPDGTIIVGSVSGTVYALNPADGSTIWTFTALDDTVAAPGFSADGMVYVTSFDHRVYALQVIDGVRIWSYTTTDAICTAPSVGHDGRIYVGNVIGDLYCITPAGQLVWDVQSCNAVTGPLSVGPDGSVYVGLTSEPGGLLVVHQDLNLTILPDSFSIVRGALNSGNVCDLFFSDDLRLDVRAGLTLFLGESPLQVVATGTSSVQVPSELRFKLEAHVNTPGLTQSLQLFNYDTSSYEQVDFSVPGFADTSVEVVITTNPERFVQAGTREMRAKMVYRQVGLTLLWPWSTRLDQATWTIAP